MPAQIKLYLVTFGFFIFAIFLGQAVAKEDYDTIALIIFLTLFVLLIIIPGYEFFLALGIVSPFILPLPFVRGFPFFGLMLGVCIIKFAFTRSLEKAHAERHRCFTIPMLIFFGWVLFRYLMNPVKPNVGGSFGTNVTGFRAFFNYGICGLFVLTLGFFIQTKEQAVKLVRWIGIFTAFFTCLLMAAAISGNVQVAQILTVFGVFVGFFDTGFMRLVVLPLLGCILIALCFLPNVFAVGPTTRKLMLLLSVSAVFVGGSRAGILGAFATIFACALVRRRIVVVTTALVVIAGCLMVFRFIGEYYNFREGVGLLRVISLVSERAAQLTDASDTYKWRQIRWERAITDIKQHPLIGFSYGGLDNAYTFASRSDWESASIDIDLAAGSIHNGYLSGARAFGVPFCLIFIYIMISRIVSHGIQSARQQRIDPVLGDLHAFIFANLICQAFYISVGTDLNHPVIWSLLALGLLISRLKPAESPATQPNVQARYREPAAQPGVAEIPLPASDFLISRKTR